MAPDISETSLDLTTEENRIRLGKLLLNLFGLWQLSDDEKLYLLGLTPADKDVLEGLCAGKPLPDSRDMHERAGWLLSIHKNLRILYPQNPNIRHSWVTLHHNGPNEFAPAWRPLDVMMHEGIGGLAGISRFLDEEIRHA